MIRNLRFYKEEHVGVPIAVEERFFDERDEEVAVSMPIGQPTRWTSWYVDLPEYIENGLGSKGNLAMVAGADTFLEFLAQGANEVTVSVSTEPIEGYEILDWVARSTPERTQQVIDDYNHPVVEYGGDYVVRSSGHKLWLCPVAEYVFGGIYPKNIYIQPVYEPVTR